MNAAVSDVTVCANSISKDDSGVWNGNDVLHDDISDTKKWFGALIGDSGTAQDSSDLFYVEFSGAINR